MKYSDNPTEQRLFNDNVRLVHTNKELTDALVRWARWFQQGNYPDVQGIACDTFAALGPFLVTRDEIGDPKALEMSLKVNDVLRQHSAAGEMIFDVPESIAFISQFITLEPGDLICMGTPGGVGATTSTYLQPGDEVVAEIEKLGRLVNTVE